MKVWELKGLPAKGHDIVSSSERFCVHIPITVIFSIVLGIIKLQKRNLLLQFTLSIEFQIIVERKLEEM